MNLDYYIFCRERYNFIIDNTKLEENLDNIIIIFFNLKK